MRRYGSDKPDLRVPLELVDVADLVRGCDFKVFAGPAADPRGRVAALVRAAGRRHVAQGDRRLHGVCGAHGAKGLAYVKVNEIAKGREGLQSPILKFLSGRGVGGILERTGAADGDLIFFAPTAAKGGDALGALPPKGGPGLEARGGGMRPLWVVDFPHVRVGRGREGWQAMHHPFTSPANLDYAALGRAPARRLPKPMTWCSTARKSRGGSVRHSFAELQSVVFDLLGISPEEARAKFGSCWMRFKFGAPPHAHRFGLDRLAMLMARSGQYSRCDRLPEDADGGGSLDGCADEVSEAQLKELHIRVAYQPRPMTVQDRVTEQPIGARNRVLT